MNTSSQRRMETDSEMLGRNDLLAALTGADIQRLAADLEQVSLPQGRVLCELGEIPEYVYFPTTCIVSVTKDLEDGSTMEIAAIGNDGLVGMSLILGGNSGFGRSVVRSAGEGFRLRASKLAQEFYQEGHLRNVLLRYAQALIVQISQTVACTRSHRVEQQLCRALLFTLDRLPTNEFATTHELLANILGVRRESVTATLGMLQSSGVIHCERGRVTLVNRRKLESHVCECYAAVKAACERLVPRCHSQQPAVIPARRVSHREPSCVRRTANVHVRQPEMRIERPAL